MPKLSATPRQLLFLLLAGGALLYARSLSSQFVYDDAIQIVSNPRITAWTYAPSYFTQQLWTGIQSASYYRPLLLIWLRLNHALFAFNPVGWHAALIALHLAATAVAFLLARRLLQDPSAALVAAAIFLTHPIQVESAAWPSAANEPLAAIFVFACYLLFLKSRVEESNRDLLLSWLMFALALLSKETAIAAPLTIFVLAYFHPRKGGTAPRWADALAAEVPFAIMVGIYLAIRKLVLAHAAPTTIRTDLATSLFTGPSVIWSYISHLVVPARLAMVYDLPPVASAASPLFWAPLLALLAIVALCIWLWKRSHAVPVWVGLLWIPLHLSIPIATIPLFRNSDFAHDRYLYVPLFGFALLLAYGWQHLGSTKTRTVVATFLLAFYAVTTFHQQAFWRDDAALFARAYNVSPGAYLADVLQGQQLAHEKKFPAAVSLLRSAASKQPDNPTALVLLATTHCEMKDFAATQSLFTAALRLDPGSAEAHYLLGKCQLANNETAAAIPALRQAVALLGTNLEYRLALAGALNAIGRRQEAIEQYKAAEQLAPANEREFLRGYVRRLQGSADQ